MIEINTRSKNYLIKTIIHCYKKNKIKSDWVPLRVICDKNK